MSASPLSRKVYGWVDGYVTPADTFLEFHDTDPLVVYLTVDGVQWRIARELLRDGLRLFGGLADIQAWVIGADLRLQFRWVAEGGTAGVSLVALSKFDVARFLTRVDRELSPAKTDAAVASGLDAWLAGVTS